VDVVRGDIILLETGDVVPADLRLITAADLRLGPRTEDLPSVIKPGNGKSLVNGGFRGKIIYKWGICHCHV